MVAVEFVDVVYSMDNFRIEHSPFRDLACPWLLYPDDVVGVEEVERVESLLELFRVLVYAIRVTR